MNFQLFFATSAIIYNHTHLMYNISMVVNNESSLAKIRRILKDQRGVLLTSDLAKLDIPRTYLSILEQKGEIERVSRGVYRAPASLEDEMFSFQSVYKASMFSHETALYLHDLTDRSPLFYSLTVPSGYHSEALNKSGHKIFYVKRPLFDLGVMMMKSTHGNEIRGTDLERTLCDILRSRNQMDPQTVSNAMKRYGNRPDKNIDLLYRYARQFRIQKIVRDTIEILL